MTKEEALTKYVGAEGGHSDDYLIYTDEEAMQACKEYILDNLWAFNKSFLDGHSEVISEMDDKVFCAIQELCECANETIKRLIDDLDYCARDAIACDGRGHFLSSYDGEEIEFEGYYIYRIN